MRYAASTGGRDRRQRRRRRALAKGSANLVAGTPWLFARPEMEGTLDTLFIDEAGQLSLANVVAVGNSARSIVLLGDPNQLPQVSQGVHPDGVGVSALEHLLGGADTIDPRLGLFLDETWRMHPRVNGYVSDMFYDGRLRRGPSTAIQRVESIDPTWTARASDISRGSMPPTRRGRGSRLRRSPRRSPR